MCDGKYTRDVVEREVGEQDVGCVPEAATAAVRWRPACHARPRLDVCAISHVVDFDVARRDVLDCLEGAWILPDTTDSNTEARVELAVFDKDVS